MSPFSHATGLEYGGGSGGSKQICMWCGSTGLGGVVHKGTIVHICGRPEPFGQFDPHDGTGRGVAVNGHGRSCGKRLLPILRMNW